MSSAPFLTIRRVKSRQVGYHQSDVTEIVVSRVPATATDEQLATYVTRAEVVTRLLDEKLFSQGIEAPVAVIAAKAVRNPFAKKAEEAKDPKTAEFWLGAACHNCGQAEGEYLQIGRAHV